MEWILPVATQNKYNQKETEKMQCRRIGIYIGNKHDGQPAAISSNSYMCTLYIWYIHFITDIVPSFFAREMIDQHIGVSCSHIQSNVRKEGPEAGVGGMACPHRILVILYQMLAICTYNDMIWLMYGILFLHLSTSEGCFCPRTFFSKYGQN